MNITYKNTITADELNAIRKSMGFRQLHPKQQQANIDGNALIIAAYDAETAIAMAGLTWTGGSFAYANVVINPQYCSQGIEDELINRVFDFLRSKLEPGYGIQVNIFVRSGQEKVYENLGFIHATPENTGVPMRICLTSQVELTDKMFNQMEYKRS